MHNYASNPYDEKHPSGMRNYISCAQKNTKIRQSCTQTVHPQYADNNNCWEWPAVSLNIRVVKYAQIAGAHQHVWYSLQMFSVPFNPVRWEESLVLVAASPPIGELRVRGVRWKETSAGAAAHLVTQTAVMRHGRGQGCCYWCHGNDVIVHGGRQRPPAGEGNQQLRAKWAAAYGVEEHIWCTTDNIEGACVVLRD